MSLCVICRDTGGFKCAKEVEVVNASFMTHYVLHLCNVMLNLDNHFTRINILFPCNQVFNFCNWCTGILERCWYNLIGCIQYFLVLLKRILSCILSCNKSKVYDLNMHIHFSVSFILFHSLIWASSLDVATVINLPFLLSLVLLTQ